MRKLSKSFEVLADVKSDQWNEEPVLQEACVAMGEELDWDSLDSGRLHRFTADRDFEAVRRVLDFEMELVEK